MDALEMGLKASANAAKEVVKAFDNGLLGVKRFNFKSQPCTSREQSERLLSLGLKEETADMRYDCIGRMSDTEMIYREKPIIGPVISYHDIPAWSLHRLLCLLPDYIVVNSSSGLNPNFYLNIRDGFVSYKDNRGFSYGSTSGNMYDAITTMISFLIKEGYFNKEYLEEWCLNEEE